VSTSVQLRALTKRYVHGAAPVVDAVDLDVAPGTLTTLLGPSGCGKTTTLKMLAGLVEPSCGDVCFDGRSVVAVPAERREVAMVFQKPLLFPHMSVADNVAFGLRMRGVDRAARRRRVGDMLELVRLSGYESRRATELSGGQEQRVSLARALVVEPRVLLLDEPLSQLDAGLRVEMRELVRQVQREVGVTTLFVTHDQEEAVVLSDRVALMLDGRVEQDDVPEAFYERPATLRVARFFGTENLIDGVVADGRWRGLTGVAPAACVPDGPGVLAVRQEALTVSTVEVPGHVPAVVEQGRYLGTSIRLDLRARGLPGDDADADARGVAVDAGPVRLRATVPPTVKVAPGDTVWVAVPDGHGHVLPGRARLSTDDTPR
jgi:ABC-type Fe3+/spermidine/putrescine transport system ATPase subunit